MRPGEVLRRFWLLLRRDRATAELEEEMRLHRDLRAASLLEGGATVVDAATAARRRFGNPVRAEEESRDAWGLGSLDDLSHDVHYAVRRLHQHRGFATTVVAVLALGIGATTTMFSAVDAATFRPLPFPYPEQLVIASGVNADRGDDHRVSRLVDIADLAELGVFSHLAGYATGALNLAGGAGAERVHVGIVSRDFFATLRVTPRIGRVFTEDETAPNAPLVAIVSYRLWQRRFGSADLIGRPIELNGKRFTVVGVMPPEFSFPEGSELWIPMSLPLTRTAFEPVRSLGTTVIGRIADSVSPERAERRVQLRWQQALAARTQPPAHKNVLDYAVEGIRRDGALFPFRRELTVGGTHAITLLFAATGILLLVAIVNVTGLLLAHGSFRAREIAIRQVLGATRLRLVRQLFAETLLLSLSGALLGVVSAPLALRALDHLLPGPLVSVSPARIDARVLAFAAAVAMLTGLFAGLWPAIRATREEPAEAIKRGGGPGTSGGTSVARHLLMAAQLTLTTALLIGAVLLLQSLRRIAGVDRGMRTDHVMTAEMSFPHWTGGPGQRRSEIGLIAAQLRAIPGIAAVAFANDLPLGDQLGMSVQVAIEGSTATPDTTGPRGCGGCAHWVRVSPQFFDALGVRLMAGRFFTEHDDSLAPPVAIVSKSIADAFFPGLNPLGRIVHLEIVPDATIVGVVADLDGENPERPVMPQIYTPIAVSPPADLAVIVRGTLPEAALAARLRAAVQLTDRAQAVYDLKSMDDVVGDAIAPHRTNAELLGFFAALALLLAALGVYAAIGQSVTIRRREFGIRLALGSSNVGIVRLVVTNVAAYAFSGIAVGTAVAWAAARVITTLLYSVTPHDATAFAVAPLVVIVSALVASLAPTWRAVTVRPAEVMRTE